MKCIFAVMPASWRQADIKYQQVESSIRPANYELRLVKFLFLLCSHALLKKQFRKQHIATISEKLGLI